MNNLMKIFNILRYGAGVVFILAGIGSANFLIGILYTLWGISFFPVLYEKTGWKKYKNIQILLPIILFVIAMIATPTESVNTNTNTEEKEIVEDIEESIQEEQVIQLTGLKFEETEEEIDIKETKEVFLKVTPIDATNYELEFNSTNSEIAKVEKNLEKSSGNEIYLNIYPVGEGECELFVSANGIESNRIKVTIIDKERIENEKKTAEELKKETEEQDQQTTNETSSSSTTNKSSNTSTSKTSGTTSNNSSNKTDTTEITTSNSSSTTSSSSTASNQSSSSPQSTSNNNNSHGKQVYRTPNGSKYHFDPDCGGKNSYLTTLSNAISAGLGPCKKCAQ